MRVTLAHTMIAVCHTIAPKRITPTLGRGSTPKSKISIAQTEISQASVTHDTTLPTTITVETALPYSPLQPRYASNGQEQYIITVKSPKGIHIKVYTQGIQVENC